MNGLTEDEFISWRHHPVTKTFFDVIGAHLQEIKDQWMVESWGRGVCSPERLAELKGRHKGLEEFMQMEFKDIVASIEWQSANNGNG